jgi:sugar phosphate isomerase/epimerase
MDISLQLYSIKEEAQESFAKALEITAKAGYQGVEFAGYFGLSPEAMKDLLQKYGLKAVSTHAGADRLRDGLTEELRYAKVLGYSLIVCPGVSCKTKEETVANAKLLEDYAQKAAKEGVVMGYHNHSHEFTKFEGRYALDILFENAPSLKFQPDLFWIAHAGVDPAGYIKPLAASGRICAVHAKEMAKTGTGNVYVGQGRIDFKAAAALCSPARYPWIVEQEEFSSDHADGVRRSYEGLRAIIGK